MPFISGRSTFQRITGALAAKPTAPTITGSSAGNQTLEISFTAPSFNGGLPIIGYEYSINGGSTWSSTNSGTSSPRTISGLTNGTNYTVLLRAVNALGSGASSNSFNDTATLTTQPFTIPSAPTLGTLATSIASPGQVSTPAMSQDCTNASFSWSSPGASGVAISVPFTAPANNGRPITNYEYSTDNGVNWNSAGTTSTPISIIITSDTDVSLSAGTTYNQIRLRAVNAGGPGTQSSAGSITTPAAVTGYDIQVYNNRGTETLVETVLNHPTASYSRSHNQAESDWSVKVRAKNSNGDGSYSNESSAATGWTKTSCTSTSCDNTSCEGCGTKTKSCQKWTRNVPGGGGLCTDGACDVDCGACGACSGSWSSFDASSYTGPITTLLIDKNTGGDPRYIELGGYYFTSPLFALCTACDCYYFNADIYSLEKCNLYPANSTDPAAYRWTEHTCFFVSGP